MGAYLNKSVSREMYMINTGIWVTWIHKYCLTSSVNWRTIAWKKPDELLSLESYHLLSVHILKERSCDNLTVPLPRILIHDLDFEIRGLMYAIQFPFINQAMVNHVCALTTYNKHYRVKEYNAKQHRICFELSIYCWWQPINLISCTIFNGTAN